MPLITFPIIQEHIISLKYSKGTTTNTIGKTALLATQSFLDHAILHPIFTLLNFANTFVFIKHGPQPWAQPPNWRTRSSSTFTRDNIRTSLLVVMQEVYPSCNHYCKALYWIRSTNSHNHTYFSAIYLNILTWLPFTCTIFGCTVWMIQVGSDIGAWRSEFLDFLTSSIDRYSKEHNAYETG
jgi:hypothetical protein